MQTNSTTDPNTGLTDVEEMEQAPDSLPYQGTRIAADVSQLATAFDNRYGVPKAVEFNRFPVALTKAIIVVILNSVVLSPNGVELHNDTATAIALLATDAGVDPEGEAIEHVERLMQIAVDLRGKQSLYHLILQATEAINDTVLKNKDVLMMIDEAISVSTAVTNSEIVGQHLEAVGLKIVGSEKVSLEGYPQVENPVENTPEEEEGSEATKSDARVGNNKSDDNGSPLGKISEI